MQTLSGESDTELLKLTIQWEEQWDANSGGNS